MIYLVCPFCKTEQDMKNKICKKCGQPIPKDKRSYKIVVWYQNKRVVKRVPILDVAKEIELKIKTEMISGDYFDRRQKKKEEIIFDIYFYEIYVPYIKQNKKTWKNDEIVYRIWAQGIIGNKSIDAISQIDIEKIKKLMAENNRSPRTIQKMLAMLKHAFNIAKNLSYFSKDNPLANVQMPKVNNKRMRFLTKDEAHQLLELTKASSETLYEMCALSLYCGLRFGEIANIHYCDIDLENKRIYIRDPKNQTARVIIMPQIIKEIMQNKKSTVTGEDLVYKNRLGHKYQEVLRESFYKIINQIGLNNNISDPRQKVVFHTLRHTFASWLAIQGTPIYTIKELMGHKSLSMTERYAHLIPDIKAEAIESLAKNFSD